jgi:hypothetical protein
MPPYRQAVTAPTSGDFWATSYRVVTPDYSYVTDK